jgi:hypothetical protein
MARFLKKASSRRTFYRHRRQALDLIYLESVRKGADLEQLAAFFNEHVWYFLLAPEWRKLRKHVAQVEPRLAELIRADHFEDPGWSQTGQTDDEWRQPADD